MLRNYLRVTFRNLWRQKTFNFINILGLAIGIAVCTVLFLYLDHEWSFDRDQVNADRTFRIIESVSSEGEDSEYGETTSDLLLPELSEIPGVETAARYIESSAFVKLDDAVIEEAIAYTDADYLNIFNRRWVRGRTPERLGLDEILISRNIAEKYFGKTSPIGKTLDVRISGEYRPMKVTAVYENPGTQTVLRAEMIASFEYLRKRIEPFDSWQLSYCTTFALLEKDASPKTVQETLEYHIQKLGVFSDDQEYKVGYILQPLTACHLSLFNLPGYPSEVQLIHAAMLLAVTLLILLMAGINFTVIMAGMQLPKLHESGLRKVLGASHSTIRIQKMVEVSFYIAVSILIGVVLAKLTIVQFQSLMPVPLHLHMNVVSIRFLIALWVVLTLAAGYYPANVFAGIPLRSALKSEMPKISKGGARRTLIFTQFTLTAILVCTTLLISRQLLYVTDRDPGFSARNLVGVQIDNDLRSQESLLESFRERLLASPEVESASLTYDLFGYESNGFEIDVNDEKKSINALRVDSDYITAMGLNIVQGRDFSDEYGQDATQSVLVNQGFADLMGWENPIGKSLPDCRVPTEIVGVVKDFNFQSYHHTINPLVLYQNPVLITDGYYESLAGMEIPYRWFLIRFKPGAAHRSALLDRTWQTVMPDEYGLVVSYLDDVISTSYQTEQHWSDILLLATTLALVIATVGVFGITLIHVNQRLKEVSIRRVLGAEAWRIFGLFFAEMGLLVIVANLLAGPVTYILFESWIQNFAYQSSFGWWLFVVTLTGTLLISSTTVLYNVIRVLNSNPMRFLRSE